MVRPNFIPRTLRGVGGVRLFDIPGVVYPKEMLVAKAGLNQKDGKPYSEAPSWGITSQDAAHILGCTPAAARAWLHRRKVPFRIVCDKGRTVRLYWRKEKVEALAQKRPPVVQTCPGYLIPSAEALRILHVGRSSLHRYEEKGKLNVTKVRKPSSRGLRKCSYFNRKEVERLAANLAALRKKEAELLRLHRRVRLRPLSATADDESSRKRKNKREW